MIRVVIQSLDSSNVSSALLLPCCDTKPVWHLNVILATYGTMMYLSQKTDNTENKADKLEIIVSLVHLSHFAESDFC